MSPDIEDFRAASGARQLQMYSLPPLRRVCKQNQRVAVIGPNNRGFATHIASAFELPLAETSCVNCGQCIAVCPTGALTERDDTEKVWEALADPSKHVVVGPAPSVRAQLGECFGMPIGTNVEGKMVAALRRLGFDRVFDVDTAADVTIMEEGTEFLDRLKNGGKLPLITSCSPGWIKFCEHYYPEFLDNLSSCKVAATDVWRADEDVLCGKGRP